MNFSKKIFVILALVMLSCSGCSMVKLGYNNADWMLRYWITDYTSFNEQQKETIRLEVADYMRWHRQNALPAYTAFLQDLSAQLDRDKALNTADVIHAKAEIIRLYKLTMTPTIRPAAQLLSTLDKQQIEGLRDTLDKANRKQRKEARPENEQEQLVEREKSIVKLVEMLAGALSDEQENTIRQMSRRLPLVTTAYLEQREAKQARLIALLMSHADTDQIAVYFSQWLNTPPAPGSPHEQQIITAYDSAINEMIVQIYGLLTAEQKNHLRKMLADFIDDIQKLHVPAKTSGTAHES